jgi:hypothetical protein
MFRKICFILVGLFLISGCSFEIPTSYPVVSRTVEQTEDKRLISTATRTETPIIVSGSDTPDLLDLEEIPTATLSPLPDTPLPSSTTTDTPTPIPLPDYRFMIQPGSPKPAENIFHPELGCSWLGISGQIFNILDQPLSEQMVLHVKGTLENEIIDILTIVPENNFFLPGGFDIRLADLPVASSGTLYLVLYDLDGNQVSDKVFITTYSDCMKNTIIVNFVEIPPVHALIFLPFVVKP